MQFDQLRRREFITLLAGFIDGVVLKMAAEAGSAPAALALGTTYDPTIVQEQTIVQEHKAPTVQKQMAPTANVVARTDPVGSAATDPVTDIAMARPGTRRLGIWARLRPPNGLRG
jgi:hypothetical protein